MGSPATAAAAKENDIAVSVGPDQAAMGGIEFSVRSGQVLHHLEAPSAGQQQLLQQEGKGLQGLPGQRYCNKDLGS